MKPLSLTLTAFGSYPGTEVVDFSALSGLGLYVVTGPTGSGKTTVFDAMAYALYGRVPGVRDAGDIRSHHADPSVLCSVTLRFEVDGEVYWVERSPEQFRAGKRKGADLVKQSAKAVLVRESDDVTLASRASAASEACAALVGLNADQFERVVLLPQGRFQQFLLADTKERQPLLRQLFDTGRWLTVTERLKERMVAAKAEVAAIDAQLGNHRHSLIGNLRQAAEHLGHDNPLLADDESAAAASLDALDALRAELDRAAVGRRSAAGAAADTARLASELEATATRVVTDWTTRRELRSAAAALESRGAQIERTRSQLVADAAAQPVAAAIAALATAARQVDDATGRLDTVRQAVVEACADAGLEASASVESLVTAIAETRSALATQRRALDAVIAATGTSQRLSGELQDATAERAGITDRLGEIDADLVVRAARLAELEPVAAHLALQQVAVTEAAEALDTAARVAELVVSRADAAAALVAATEQQQTLTARFIADAAPRLAARLQPDHPCPVCGSVEHPAPASTDTGDAVDAAELDRAAGVISKAAAAVEALDTELGLRRSSLGEHADRPIEQFEESLAAARAACIAAETAVGERDVLATAIDAIRLDRERLAARAAQLDIDLARLGAEQGAAATELATARAGLGALATRFDTEGAALVSALELRGRALDHLERATTDWGTALSELEGRLGARSGAESLLAGAITASGLADRSAAEAAILAPEVRAALAAEVAAHDTERARVDARLPELEALELPVECPDISTLQSDAAEKRAIAAALADDVSRIDERLGEDDTRGARGDLAAARAIAATSADALARSEQLTALARTCDGQGPRKVSLETWVLAGELDRVVLAASIHLDRMTAGRYRLERTDAAAHGSSQAGLELRVLDAHTGVARRPASLSGGEQFQASLALALGLADVVSQGGSASGRVFEALFVDEGFGSLDPESLGQAVDALHQIHATGRTVGVITHVEAMKEDLQLGIRVDRLPDGRGSTLRCHPEI